MTITPASKPKREGLCEKRPINGLTVLHSYDDGEYMDKVYAQLVAELGVPLISEQEKHKVNMTVFVHKQN